MVLPGSRPATGSQVRPGRAGPAGVTWSEENTATDFTETEINSEHHQDETFVQLRTNFRSELLYRTSL